MSDHVHCYDDYPDQPARCASGEDAWLMEPGDRISTPDGTEYEALPDWQGEVLVVARDGFGAQVAVRVASEEDALREVTRELAGAVA